MRAIFVILSLAVVLVNADQPNKDINVIETIYYVGKPDTVDIVFGEVKDVQKYMGYIVENDMSLESAKPFFTISSLSSNSLYTIVVTPLTNMGEFGEPMIHMFHTLEEEIAPTKTTPPRSTKPFLLDLIEEESGSGDVEEETTIEEQFITTMTYPNELPTTTTTTTTSTIEITTFSTTESTTSTITTTTATFTTTIPTTPKSTTDSKTTTTTTEVSTTTETFPNKPPTTIPPVTAQSPTSNPVQDVAVEGLIRDSFDKDSVTISWSPVPDAEEYLVEFIQVNLKDDSNWDSLTVKETHVRIGNLLKATYYTVRVTAIFENTFSQPAEITTRTDGSTFEMTNIWSFDGGYPQLGSAWWPPYLTQRTYTAIASITFKV